MALRVRIPWFQPELAHFVLKLRIHMLVTVDVAKYNGCQTEFGLRERNFLARLLRSEAVVLQVGSCWRIEKGPFERSLISASKNPQCSTRSGWEIAIRQKKLKELTYFYGPSSLDSGNNMGSIGLIS